MLTLVILMYWFTSVLGIVHNASFNVNVFHEYFGFGITLIRSSHWRCSAKKVFLKISPNLHGNTCARVSFLIKLQVEFPEIHTKTSSSQCTSGRLLLSYYIYPKKVLLWLLLLFFVFWLFKNYFLWLWLNSVKKRNTHR